MNGVEVNTNLRSLKRTDSGFELATSKAGELCEYCTRNFKCSLLKKMMKLEASGDLKLSIRGCGSYVPPLTFGSEKGLLVSGFNTLRLGEAWAKRLRVGDYVDLLHSGTMDLIRTAEVARIVSGPKLDMIRAHSHLNHMYIEEGLKRKDAAAKMTSLLPSLYGGLIFRNNESATVIYFE